MTGLQRVIGVLYFSLILHIRQSIALKLSAYDNSPLWSYTLKGQGYAREQVAQIWHYNISLWSTCWATQSFDWNDKGAASAASFPVLSLIKLPISPCMLSKHHWLSFTSVPRWFMFAHAPHVIISKADVAGLLSIYGKSIGLSRVKSWWHTFADVVSILSIAPEGLAAAGEPVHMPASTTSNGSRLQTEKVAVIRHGCL